MIPVLSTIFELIDADDAAALRELLAKEPGAAAAHDEQGLTAVMRASYRGGDVFDAVRAANPPLEPFDRIVVGEADGLPAPDAVTPDGFTPLHIAAFAHNVEAARKLLDAGAGPRHRVVRAGHAAWNVRLRRRQRRRKASAGARRGSHAHRGSRVHPARLGDSERQRRARRAATRLRAARRATFARPRASRTPRARPRP